MVILINLIHGFYTSERFIIILYQWNEYLKKNKAIIDDWGVKYVM